MKNFVLPVPKVGDTIYVGVDDWINGGRAVVCRVREGISGGEPTMYVSTWADTSISYNWEFLAAEQKKLEERYGDRIAYPSSDSYRSRMLE